MEQPGLSREIIHERAQSLPLVDHSAPMTDTEALAFVEDLRQNNPILYDNLQEVIDKDEMALAAEIGDRLAPSEIRSIVARVAIDSAAQALSDIGIKFIALERFRRN